MNKKEVYVFLDFAIESENVGRVVIKLDYSVVPKSVENFRCLCTGEKGFGKLGKPLHYKNTVVHKAIPEYMIQCGDITNGNGTGGESIYGPFFEDENFTLQHDVAGIIGMANIGKKNTNSSQFYITVVPCLHLNEKNVAIGRVVKGLDVVREISETETVKDVPVKKCEITNCGQLEKDSDWGLCELDGTADVYPPFPQDWDAQLNEITVDDIINITTNIKNSGNEFYQQNNYSTAERKYLKAVRYIRWYEDHLKAQNTWNEDIFKSALIVCFLNLAAVKIQTKSYKECLEFSAKVLAYDKDNVKAIFREGQANIGLNNYNAGLESLYRAHRLAPADKAVISEIKKAKEFLNNYYNAEKKIFTKMFNSIA